MRHRTVSLLTALLAGSAAAQTALEPGEQVSDAAAAEVRGFDYWLGRGVERDSALAAHWLEQAAAGGRPYAAAVLAGMYQRGESVTRDLTRAHELNTQAALGGIASAQASLGFDAIAAAEPDRDPAAAYRWLSAAAEQDEAFSLFLLGQMHRFGDGVEQNRDLGLRLLTRAAELGYPPAGTEAGRLLLEGDSVSEDIQRGVYFLRAAAQSNYGPGAYWLGKAHLAGRHVERNAGLAAQWLTRATDLQVRPAALWLAELYAKGLGVESDTARAAELREQALPAMAIDERNGFAWELAVSPDADLRNGAFAVEIMELVVAEWPSPAYLDTLAAAYAEAGRFDDAVRTQQRALEGLPSTVPAGVREPYAERMEIYRSGLPYREAS